MSLSPKTAADGKSVEDTCNLPTPALSPISEHETPFPDILGNANRLDDVHHQELDAGHHSRVESKVVVASADDGEGLPARRRSSEARALKLSPSQVLELTTSPDSLPLRTLDGLPSLDEKEGLRSDSPLIGPRALGPPFQAGISSSSSPVINGMSTIAATPASAIRPATASRSASNPVFQRRQSSSKSTKSKPQLPALKTDEVRDRRSSSNSVRPSPNRERHPSPMPSVLPIPPLSLPTYLHLELSSDRPSALYIHRSEWADFPYESSQIKFERLLNFFYLPPNLEQVLWFGAIACLDAWLYTFTILPLRFLKALVILARWMVLAMTQEARLLASFVYGGVGRIWQRQRGDSVASSQRPLGAAATSEGDESRRPTAESQNNSTFKPDGQAVPQSSGGKKLRSGYRHRRAKSTPSALLPNHKADLLQGLLIVCSCAILMSFDASRMYHSIRGQSAIKLYVIYNMLEVFDRLFSAIGQDILECLFSKETLERDEDGRSKLVRPLMMFMLALVYNVIHATALFYQVVTLNVAVNSYSNALLTLLMSNQFVEIKGTVFKKFEKENLFQLTCADVVERFQLWLMLIVIACRNIVEVGGLSISISSALSGGDVPTGSFPANGTGIPLMSGFTIPKAFTILPKWTGEVLGPFLIVLGSEALVDWCKHAYIGKFNNIKPNIYGRFLDVLAKDYYSHAFADQNLTKRFGLPVIPLSCLFIRACMQTYHMFLATHMPLPIPSSATSIAEPPSSSPLTTAALQHIDQVFRRALGRSSFGAGSNHVGDRLYDFDDFIALATMVMFFLAIYLVCLAFKLVLGIGLLNYARRRYKGMKERERESADVQGRRVGGWGTVEVNEDKRRSIYEDDPEGVHQLREKERKGREKAEKGEMKLDGVERYVMASKRIW